MQCWAFGEFVLDLNTHELARAGTPVSLSPKAFQLLGILVENHPKALSRIELQGRLWPGTFVVEKNLTNLVSEIRGALSDDPVRPRFIRTVHRFGYAFQGAPATESRDRKVNTYAAGVQPHAARVPVSTIAARNSLVVLPLANLSADSDNDYFADGLTDELIGDLSKIRDLRVICRRSAMACKNLAKDVRSIAAELGVQYVVEGSVRRAGDRLRVTAQLVNASTNSCVWSDRYDGVLDDVFAIQERLARTIADALEVRLTSEEDARLAARPFPNVHAHECYLRARQQIWRWRKDSIDYAIQIVSNGLRIVGENALLYATLGLAHVLSREAGTDLGEARVTAAEECARKVTALDPTLPEGLLLRGGIHFARARIADAVHAFQAALDADPNNADALSILSNCYLISGCVDRARPLVERFSAVDPLNPLSHALRGYADMLEGRSEAAVAAYCEMLEMDPSSPMARLFYGMSLVRAGQRDEAATVLSGFGADVQESLGARLGACLRAAADGTIHPDLARLADEFRRVGTISDMFARFLAWCHAQVGDSERAVYWLRVAADRGFINYPFLAEHDVLLAKIRDDPSFQAFLRTVRERWERFRRSGSRT
jgi:TolB-like protein/thioredoxin-like negative regulator of GroEL